MERGRVSDGRVLRRSPLEEIALRNPFHTYPARRAVPRAMSPYSISGRPDGTVELWEEDPSPWPAAAAIFLLLALAGCLGWRKAHGGARGLHSRR